MVEYSHGYRLTILGLSPGEMATHKHTRKSQNAVSGGAITCHSVRVVTCRSIHMDQWEI
jgi:hypothetical protein